MFGGSSFQGWYNALRFQFLRHLPLTWLQGWYGTTSLDGKAVLHGGKHNAKFMKMRVVEQKKHFVMLRQKAQLKLLHSQLKFNQKHQFGVIPKKLRYSIFFSDTC